ncbi:alanine racemase, partial [Microvirga sp. KLBC 81]|uniref:alanine racemase C-terminal domain-containing protein n=2 Tax=Alphaproteobacteria TaxID=28211 RepID=UPI000D516428
MAIDVTGCDEARPGEMVELLGPEVPLDEISTAAGTAAYETLVRLSPRAERIYVGAAG